MSDSSHVVLSCQQLPPLTAHDGVLTNALDGLAALVLKPQPLTYESGALDIELEAHNCLKSFLLTFSILFSYFRIFFPFSLLVYQSFSLLLSYYSIEISVS